MCWDFVLFRLLSQLHYLPHKLYRSGTGALEAQVKPFLPDQLTGIFVPAPGVQGFAPLRKGEVGVGRGWISPNFANYYLPEPALAPREYPTSVEIVEPGEKGGGGEGEGAGGGKRLLGKGSG